MIKILAAVGAVIVMSCVRTKFPAVAVMVIYPKALAVRVVPLRVAAVPAEIAHEIGRLEYAGEMLSAVRVKFSPFMRVAGLLMSKVIGMLPAEASLMQRTPKPEALTFPLT